MENLKWEKPQLIVLSHNETKENLLGSSGHATGGCVDADGDGYCD